MYKTFTRSLSKIKPGVWSDFTKRSSSLKINDSHVGLFLPQNRHNYYSPLLIDETFQQAYDVLQTEAQSIYDQIENTSDEQEIRLLLVKAEEQNPEVLYNLETGSNVDLTHPIYQEKAKQAWELYDLMILMQRLEQLSVIPDTLPTLDPKVDVQIRFPHNKKHPFNQWITPGDILPSFAVNQPPEIKIQQFDDVKSDQLFTIVLLNPDNPDLSTNSFHTSINFGVCNVPLNILNNTLSIKNYLNPNFDTFQPYVPLTPEINSGSYQRACLWVFKQHNNEKVSPSVIEDNGNFNIRQFSESLNLTPVGAHVWRQVFDRSVNDVRSQYGLPEGRVFHRVRKAEPLV